VERVVTGRSITSLTNPLVKAARGLHLRKAREESGLFLVEGLKSVTEGVRLGHAPRLLLHGTQIANHPLVRDAAAVARETAQVSDAILAKISRRDNPQAALAVFEQRLTPLAAIVPDVSPCWIALQAVRDPGNLGAIVRTADAAGCGGVILVGDCCDPYSVEAVRATMGSIFAVTLVRASVEAFIAWRRGWPGGVVGTLLSATTDFRGAVHRSPTLILMGSERAGLTADLAEICDVTVKIPMRGRADSLNLAVATGVMIYAVVS
jgi:TrmH family RNA methyltransferase